MVSNIALLRIIWYTAIRDSMNAFHQHGVSIHAYYVF